LFRVFRVIKWCDSDPALGLFRVAGLSTLNAPPLPHSSLSGHSVLRITSFVALMQ
jgi:hypothetical protein